MPLYEYECTQCGKIEEAIQKFSDPALTACRHCSGKLTKLISQSSFHLKGTGWYVTDYSNKPASASDGKKKESKTSAEKSGGSSDSDANASKSEK
jgi:putative FmdB family regulatory protein